MLRYPSEDEHFVKLCTLMMRETSKQRPAIRRSIMKTLAPWGIIRQAKPDSSPIDGVHKKYILKGEMIDQYEIEKNPTNLKFILPTWRGTTFSDGY